MTNFINEILQLIITANKNKSLQYYLPSPGLWNNFPVWQRTSSFNAQQNGDFLVQFFGFKWFR